MTFTFYPNVPAAPDDPADDQPQMQQNNSAIFNILPVDHVGFNSDALIGGKHKQVQMQIQSGNANFPQAADQGTLFTKRSGFQNLTQLYWQFDSSVVKAEPLQITNSNYSKTATHAIIPLMGGLMMVTGTSKTNGPDTLIAFGISFQSGGVAANPISVVAFPNEDISGFPIFTNVNTITPINFMYHVTATGYGNFNFSWIAIGPLN